MEAFRMNGANMKICCCFQLYDQVCDFVPFSHTFRRHHTCCIVATLLTKSLVKTMKIACFVTRFLVASCMYLSQFLDS